MDTHRRQDKAVPSPSGRMPDTLDQMPSSSSVEADIYTVVLHLLASDFQPSTQKTFEDYIEACQRATKTVSLLDFQALSYEVQNLVVDVLETAVINLDASAASVECWDAIFELFRTVENLLGEYSHYSLYLRIAAIEVVMLEKPLDWMSDSILETEYSFRNLNISRSPSPLSTLASLSSLRNFTPSPSEMILDPDNEPPLTEEPEETLHALDKSSSRADTDLLSTSDTTMPCSNSLGLTLMPTQNVLVNDVTSLDNSQSSAANDDDLEKKGQKIRFRSRKRSRTMGSRKRTASMREDKENLDIDIAL
ncbi:hypothetical protein EDD18DRAFT_1382009 [Armillaria luteobubalina]|uniref:Uncharacterized protein n=1 Tax=Armillaria luteobubalina TaxID=153913 RepID=A0AA39Q9H4_9AGAR|nr:hypothetical protein EDD18DRAFT_1382009 [Armillaria luteobubalina]